MSEGVLVQPDTKFIREVMAAGASDLKKCYQCATCSAVCELSTETVSFPRQQMLAVQWGAQREGAGRSRALAMFLLRRLLGALPAPG